MWTTIRQFNTARFSVALQYEYDADTSIHDYEPDIQDGIVRGDYDPYVFRVVVLGDGCKLGAEYLSGSLYADPKDFAREHFNGPAYFPDMLHGAIAETRKIIAAAPRLNKRGESGARQAAESTRARHACAAETAETS